MKGIAHARVVSFDTSRFDFARLVADEAFDGGPLDRLHERLAALLGLSPSSAVEAKHNNLLRQRMIRWSDDSPFYALYHTFVNEVLAPIYHGRISYSAHPTFRVHLPGTPAVSLWHRDVDVTGRDDQINAWLPFVNVEPTSALWVERDYGVGDHVPVLLTYGQMLLFDGGLLSHGSVPNRGGVTRVGCDFRFAPKRAPRPHYDILAARPSIP